MFTFINHSIGEASVMNPSEETFLDSNNSVVRTSFIAPTCRDEIKPLSLIGAGRNNHREHRRVKVERC